MDTGPRYFLWFFWSFRFKRSQAGILGIVTASFMKGKRAPWSIYSSDLNLRGKTGDAGHSCAGV